MSEARTDCGDPPDPLPADPFVEHYQHRDHLGNLRLVTDEAGNVREAHDYYPFGMELESSYGPSRWLFTGHERDKETGLDYMLARYCAPTLGRFLSVDPAGATPTNPQTWHRYAYTHNNPIVRVDRDGRNWFQINGEWEWHKGDTHTYTDDDGNEQTVESEYTHLVVFVKTGTNAEGAETGTLTVYDQDKAVLTATAFSGGGGSDAIPDGTFMIRLDIRGKADGPDALKANQQELKQLYGIQEIASTITDAIGVARDARWEWGSRRAALNEPAGETRAGYLGNYLHGKNRPGDYTQGCVCDRSGAALGYLSGLDPRAVPKVPVEVK